jgi:hypothetical protein
VRDNSLSPTFDGLIVLTTIGEIRGNRLRKLNKMPNNSEMWFGLLDSF